VVDRKLLTRSWRHSHEEDGGDTLVYRLASFPFPPSRGRHGFELKADGTAVDSAIAPQDGSAPVVGRWSFEPGDTLVLQQKSGEVVRRLQLVAAAKDKLTFRR
jgi:hypothetical protein